MATLPWGTVGYVKYYFVSRQGGLNDNGSDDREHRPCFTVGEVEAVIRCHEEDAKWLGHMAHLSIETCVEVPSVGQFWAEDFRPEWAPGTPLYCVWQCWFCDERHPCYQWSARPFPWRATSSSSWYPAYTCKVCGYDPADDMV